MTAHDPSLGRNRSGLLGWLGFGNRAGTEPLPLPETLAKPPRADRRDTARRRQLEEIGTFLATHQLELTGQSLAIAHGYLSGDDPQIARLIDRQVQARKPVTAEWLDEIAARHGQGDDLAQLSQLMERLETSIDEFGRTSQDAHKATSDYHSALEEHVSELEQVNLAGEVISELATIAKVMLKRTRVIEKQMQRSEAQTRSLKRRLEEARRSAEEDALTGLPNRRAFEARFEEEYRQARAAAEQLCVAFCDIDNFKRINDSHGHEAGDRVLKVVADCLSRISNDRCHVSRHGGEEFVVLLRDMPVEEARTRLDQLREQLAERKLVNRATDVPFGQITFSGGVADAFAFPDRRAALRAADAALYRAKQQGRNRILVAGAEDLMMPLAAA
ncbi:MAG TPA: diguanylate cyclase [Novosphingobium sp.]|nr:diguanylate cyclase [Novosphingobium sp.]HNN55975.1 diguanylate cyclase [Novosphingobium sp.]